MKQVNYQMLQEDLNFPLYADNKTCYLWTKDYNEKMYVIAQFKSLTVKLNLATKLVIHENNKTNLYTLKGRKFVFNSKNIGYVRGWGRLKYKDNAEKRQCNIANYLLNCLNSQ